MLHQNLIKIQILGVLKQSSIKTFSTGGACDSTFDLPRSTPKLLKAACRDRTASRFALAVNHPCKRSSGRSHGRRRVRGNGCEAERRCLDLRSNDDGAALRGG